MNPKDKKLIILVLFFTLISLTCQVLAQSDKVNQNQTNNKTSDDSTATLTREKMIQEIKDEVEADPDILEFILELKRQKDNEGKESYAYSYGKQEIKLEDLDESRLKELFKKVSAQTDTIQDKFSRQQIETAEEAQKRPPQPPPSLPPRPTAAPSRR